MLQSLTVQGLGHDCGGMHTALQSAFMEAAESSDAILANVGEAFYESNDAEDRSLFDSS